MKTILACLLATALLATATRADVLVYRGSLTAAGDLTVETVLPKPVNIYVVVDFGSAEFGTVIFGHINGGRHFSRGAATSASFGNASLPKGHTASFFVTGTNDTTSATNFGINTYLFRGTDKSLLIRKTPSATQVNRPIILKGTAIGGSANAGSTSFVEEHFALTFQGASTIKANNANQTIDQALDDLVTALTAQGFTSL